jgi:hypothetical protein
MGWILVATIVIIVVLMALYSVLKSGSDADDHLLGDRQYYED